MGFSTSGAAAIIFLGLLVAAGIVYPTLETAHDRRAAAIDERDERALELRNAAIDVDASYDGTAAGEELVVNVTNTGATTLSVNETDLLLDGWLQVDRTTSVSADESRERVHPGETLRITVADDDRDATGAPNRVKVVTEHGLAEIVTEVDDGQ